MADFILDTDLRIQTRTRRAEATLKELSGFERSMASGALSLANGWDRVGSYMSDGAAAFFSGAILGAVRGTIVGYGLGFVATSLLGLGMLATPLLLVSLAVCVAKDGAHSFNVMRADDPRKRYARQADWLATRGGALGDVQAPGLTQTQRFRKSNRAYGADRQVGNRLRRETELGTTQVEDWTENYSPYPGGIVPGGFQEKVAKRREAQAAAAEVAGVPPR